MRKLTLIIDGHNLAYRCYYQPNLKRLRRPSDNKKSGVYLGFLRGLHELCMKFQPDYLVVAFDPADGADNKRKDYAGYKGNRGARPKKSLIRQIFDVRLTLVHLGVRVICVQGIEADDVIYHLVQLVKEVKQDGIIVTADHDMLQCVTKRIKMWDARSKEMWTRKAVKQRYHISPERIPVYKAIVGDTTDNIAGVRGLGPKGALKLVKRFKYPQDIREHLTKKQRKEFDASLKAVSLLHHIEIAKKARTVMAMQFKPNQKYAKRLLKEYDCQSIIKNFSQWSMAFPQDTPTKKNRPQAS